jgi:hypothetical protein
MIAHTERRGNLASISPTKGGKLFITNSSGLFVQRRWADENLPAIFFACFDGGSSLASGFWLLLALVMSRRGEDTGNCEGDLFAE